MTRAILCECYDHPKFGRVRCKACSLIAFAKTGAPPVIEASVDSAVRQTVVEAVRKTLEAAARIAEREVSGISGSERSVGLRIAQRLRREAGRLG